ncbi:AAA-type ATPase family protein [Tasmannia lanceolata]|uniref:AAA-type ATPase family protein n=1 Tax=Tasmannia lanceolata TaxID=3420 RepID=UPI00406499B9
MTRSVRGNFFKDENDAISDHLRNHVHLTNCIHLKNHMHRHSPLLAERSLIRDLIVLQRSRSLRDPSTSPPSWHSPSVIDSLSKKLEKDSAVHHVRRSLGTERRKEASRLSGSSPPFASLASSKVANAELIRQNDDGTGPNDRSGMDRAKDARRGKGEGTSQKFRRSDLSGGSENPLQDGYGLGVANDLVSRKAEPKNKNILKGNHEQNVNLKTLSEQLKELTADSEDVESSHFHGRHIREERPSEEPEASGHGYGNGLNRVKKRKLRGTRRARLSVGSRYIGALNELSVASNSLAQGSTRPKYYIDEREEGADLEVTQAPRNGCGIPWNWSRIHHRGRTFLDVAGRSLSCGLSDSRLRKAEGSMPQGRRDVSDMHFPSDHSSSSRRSDPEALPLLVDPSLSQESAGNAVWNREYSGELGIFANHSSKHNRDFDLVSEARFADQRNSRGRHHVRHRSLTQKYMPKTFKDLVGQNLVVQALSNAVVRRKVGLLYAFYGPHGTGKTSCARVFARALNCQSPEHPKPCGFCDSCIAHDLGKSRNVQEVGPIGNFDFESIMNLLESMISSQLSSPYRVLIVDDCDTLQPDSWSAILKVIDLAPRRVVFVLVSTSLDHLPHIIISRCQKFFFPKLKDADIIYTLQWIATKEGLEIDKDALKLIASRSDGSLRDAEMTLDQLGLLGQRISVPLVQELVGLISDEKLVDLLDLALSADTVNTVKNLREIMEAGVEPLALMSQLATIITDILAGSYEFTTERLRRKFFRRPLLSKEDMEKLRQALKVLSEAEKQLRMSNDKLTWLTAALLQLAPDQQYILPSSTDTSFNHSPGVLNNTRERDITRKCNGEQTGILKDKRGLSTSIRMENINNISANENIMDSGFVDKKKNVGATSSRTSALSTDMIRRSGGQIPGNDHKKIEEIWLSVLEKIQLNTLKQFMYQEGKLISVSFGAAPTVKLIFSSQVNKSKAEKFKGHILRAFESVLGSSVTIEIRCDSRKDVRSEDQVPLVLPVSNSDSTQMITKPESRINERVPKNGSDNHIKRLSKDSVVKGVGSFQNRRLHSDSLEISNSEIVEIVASPREHGCVGRIDSITELEKKGLGSVWVEEEASPHHQSSFAPITERKKAMEQHQRQSIVRSKVSLAHVIQQAEGCTQRNGWSRRKAMSIAEKLEQENLRLEPRSRSLLCWKASRIPRAKLPHLRTRSRKPRSLLKLVPCTRCLCVKSPR